MNNMEGFFNAVDIGKQLTIFIGSFIVVFVVIRTYFK